MGPLYMEGEESRRSEAAVEADAEGAGVVVGEFEGEVPTWGEAPLGADIEVIGVRQEDGP